MTPEQIKQIAQAYINAPHEPNHESYKAFCEETVEQFRDVARRNWFYFSSHPAQYLCSKDMFESISLGVLHVSTVGELERFHPMRKFVRYQGTKISMLNWAFRAVHDINGHYKTRCPFETFEGEMEAYQNHAKMYSDKAQLALYSETVGQLCHYYAGFGFVSPQKCAILPIVL